MAMMVPTVFIGSSLEAKGIADALKVALDHDAHCTVWHEAFPLSKTNLESLLNACASHDFAIFVLSPDDHAVIRKKEHSVARDNVFFEAGLFMGMHGSSRTFLVRPRDVPDFHMPSDFDGFTPATYDPDHVAKNTLAGIGAAATIIRTTIAASNSRALTVVYNALADKATAYYPLKLRFAVTNRGNAPVALESGAVIPKSAPITHASSKTGVALPAFLSHKNEKGDEIYDSATILRPNETKQLWVPVDPKFGIDALEAAVRTHTAAVWHVNCTWLSSFSGRRDVQFAL